MRQIIGCAAVVAICVALAGAADPPKIEDTGKFIKVTGRAVGTTEAAQEEAKLDALREAVRQVCGGFINAQTETEDFAVVRDKVLEQPVGFARLVKVLKGPTAISGDITEVQIEAEVFPVKFERRWAEFAHIKQREGNPRCVIVVLEDENPDDLIPPITNGLVQTELENFFLKQKVELMDKGVTDAVRKRDLTLAAENGDIKAAAAAGAGFKADVVVLGRAECRRGDSVMLEGVELKRWNVTLTARVVQTDSGAILCSRTYRPNKAFTTTSASAKDALSRVGQDSAEELLSDIGKAWRERATAGKLIQLTVSPCSRREFKLLQAEMIKSKGITGGPDGFVLRELANNVANIDVNWKYDLAQLADRLEELNVLTDEGSIRLNVIEQSANRITANMRFRATATPPPMPVTTPPPKPAPTPPPATAPALQ